MIFVLRMAIRETRAAWHRLAFFFVCIALGVGAIVTIRSVVQTARLVLTGEARALLAADVSLDSGRPWTSEVLARIEATLRGTTVLDRTATIDTATLARPADGREIARMVELRAVQPGYPLYGAVTLEHGLVYSHDLLEDGGVLVRPELLAALGVQEGDGIVFGGRTFVIRGVIRREPGQQVGAFSLGPRVILDYDALMNTGLLSFGSRARYRMLLRVPEPQVESITRDLRSDLRGTLVTVRSYRSTGDRIGDDLARAENYLSLVGFVIVVLGGVGVWSVTRVFMRQKLKTIAVLKCVGGTSRQVLSTYLVQVAALGMAGSLFGIGLAWAAVHSLPASVTDALGAGRIGLTLAASFQGLAVGLLVSVLFALVPLLEARRVRPLLLLRPEGPRERPTGWAGAERSATPGPDRAGRLAIALVAAAVVATASWQAGSWSVGLVVCVGLAGMALALHLAGLALIRLIAPFARGSSFSMRHAVLHLRQPGNQTQVILLSVGLGCFFILAARGLQQNLLGELSVQLRSEAPDLFLIDIQPDQVDGVRQIVSGAKGVASDPVFIPVLRARVTGVRGRVLSLDGIEEIRGRGSLGREFVITYRDHLAPNETLVGGRFWRAEKDARDDFPQGAGEVSIEVGLRDRVGIQIGDLIRFDIAGRTVEARVTSVRRVDWEDSSNGGFMFVFRPGLLDRAPHTFLAPLRIDADPAVRARLEHDLVVRYPNVSAIDLREILDRVRAVLDAVTLAVSIVGGIALASGLLILTGAVAMTKFQRVYEAAILRTLGATTRTVAATLALEYGVLGFVAGAAGGAGALALGWAVTRYVFDIPWRPAGLLSVGGALGAGVLVAVVGVAANFDVLRRKPLATLRAE
jgi:putative ABC transport system permease protein